MSRNKREGKYVGKFDGSHFRVGCVAAKLRASGLAHIDPVKLIKQTVKELK